MNNCWDCDSTGLVDARRIAGGYRFVFKCHCISGQRRVEDFPIWGNPSRGFTKWSAPESTSNFWRPKLKIVSGGNFSSDLDVSLDKQREEEELVL